MTFLTLLTIYTQGNFNMRFLVPVLAFAMLVACTDFADAGNVKRKTEWKLKNCSNYDVTYKIEGPHGKQWEIFVEAYGTVPLQVWHSGEYCFTVCPDLESADLCDGFDTWESETKCASIRWHECRYVQISISTNYEDTDTMECSESLDYYWDCPPAGQEPESCKEILVASTSREASLSLLALSGMMVLGGAGMVLNRYSA